MGILAGDALLNYAYETAALSLIDGGNIQAKAKAIQILSNKAGLFGMLGGQVVDVENTGKPLSEDMLKFIYSLKTGALIEAAFMTGATLAGAAVSDVEALEKVGKNIGMAFQIQDDILDITSTTEELGKPIHSDEKNDKFTYVSVYGMDRAVQAVKDYSEAALNILNNLPVHNIYLNTLVEKLIGRKR